MVNAANGKLKIKFVEAYNDMGHFFPSCYECSSYFILEREHFQKLVKFERFQFTPTFKKTLDEAVEVAKGKLEDPSTQLPVLPDEIWNHPEMLESNAHIKAAGGTIWEFNGEAPTGGYVRWHVIHRAQEPELVEWSFFDAEIKFPVYRGVVSILNFFRGWKRRAEHKKWEKWREGMLKEVKNDEKI